MPWSCCSTARPLLPARLTMCTQQRRARLRPKTAPTARSRLFAMHNEVWTGMREHLVAFDTISRHRTQHMRCDPKGQVSLTLAQSPCHSVYVLPSQRRDWREQRVHVSTPLLHSRHLGERDLVMLCAATLRIGEAIATASEKWVRDERTQS